MKNRGRRRFVRGGLALAAAGLLASCGPRLPWAQPSRVRRVGCFGSSPPNPDTWGAFQQGLRELGYVEGQNLIIEYRYLTATVTAADAAAELVQLQPEVIVVPSTTDARTARAATTTIPIVNAGNGDLVTSGLVASQGRPGGNVTGLSTPVLVGKQLELLKDAVPNLSRVAFIFDRVTFDPLQRRPQYETLARALDLGVQFEGVGGPEELALAFDTAVREHASACLILLGPVLSNSLTRTAELALQSRLPSMWQNTEGVGRGGLLGYGPNRADLSRRAATYVDQILKGANPVDLPVQYPTLFDFVVNLKTARALGLIIPPSILQQATEVIQ